MATIHRKKFQEALKALKQACKNERLPFTLRIRAAELICAIYGIPLPQSSARTKRTVRELVAENVFDRNVRNQVRETAVRDAQAERETTLVKGIFDEMLKKH